MVEYIGLPLPSLGCRGRFFDFECRKVFQSGFLKGTTINVIDVCSLQASLFSPGIFIRERSGCFGDLGRPAMLAVIREEGYPQAVLGSK